MYDLLYNFLAFIKGIVGNWGVALIIFTILIRAALTPLDMKSRVGMRKTQKLQPQLQALQKKYANDKEKLNAKTAELYKKEQVNPLSSCLPLLLTWPILIIVFNAMRMAANKEMLGQVAQILSGAEPDLAGTGASFLWIKNLWMPDNVFSTMYPIEATLKGITDTNLWTNDFFNKLDPSVIESLGLTADSFAKDNLSGTIAAIVEAMKAASPFYAEGIENSSFHLNVLFADWYVPVKYNGLLLLPIFSALSQIIMTKITTGKQPQQPAANGQPNTGKFLQYFFPIFSLWICLSATASFVLYWVAGNLVSMAQTVIINKILDKREAMAAPVAGEGSVK